MDKIERYKRQIDIIHFDKLSAPIHVLGAGATGSWTTLVLAKMGCDNISVYDNDTVEEHNIASQFFCEDHKGRNKADALCESVFEQTGIEPLPYPNKDEERIKDGIIIMAVDTMAERHRLNKIYINHPKILMIDPRMGGLKFELYVIGTDKWGTTLVPPEDIEPEICTARTICFNCITISGLIGNEVRLYLSKPENFVPHFIRYGFNTGQMLTSNL